MPLSPMPRPSRRLRPCTPAPIRRQSGERRRRVCGSLQVSDTARQYLACLIVDHVVSPRWLPRTILVSGFDAVFISFPSRGDAALTAQCPRSLCRCSSRRRCCPRSIRTHRLSSQTVTIAERVQRTPRVLHCLRRCVATRNSALTAHAVPFLLARISSHPLRGVAATARSCSRRANRTRIRFPRRETLQTIAG